MQRRSLMNALWGNRALNKALPQPDVLEPSAKACQ